MDARFMRLAFSLSADVLTDFDFCVTLKLVKQYRLLRKHKRLNSVKMLVFEVFTGLPMNLMNAESFEDLLQTVQLAIHTCGDKKIWAMRKEGLSLGLKFLKQLAPAANVKTETLSPGNKFKAGGSEAPQDASMLRPEDVADLGEEIWAELEKAKAHQFFPAYLQELLSEVDEDYEFGHEDGDPAADLGRWLVWTMP